MLAKPVMKVCPACRREYADHVETCSRDGAILVPIEVQADPFIGRIIGGTYEVLQFLGGGGFGNVYKVRNTRLDDVEALKIIHPEHMRDREPLERFRQEAKLLRKLGSKSEYIVDLYTLEEDRAENLFYFTMEYVEGWPLTRFVVERGALTPERALTLMRQLCSALEVAHASGVIHRDLKLDNVLLTGEGRDERVKVLDFGIAKVLGRGSLSSLTKGMPGTPGYAAPEQIKGLADLIGPPTDLFASGVILYALLTARRPWTGQPIGEPLSEGGQWDLINKSLEGKPNPPRDYNAAIPKKLEKIILKLLEKEPRRRFQSASELDAALATVLSRVSGQSPQQSSVVRDVETRGKRPPPKWPKVMMATVAAILIAVVVIAIIVWPKPPPDGTNTQGGIVSAESGTVDTVPKEEDSSNGPPSNSLIAVQRVTVAPARDTLTAKETVQLSAKPQDWAGSELSGRAVEWLSDDERIARVSSVGLVSAVGAGTVVIRATSEGKIGTATVTVVELPPVEPSRPNVADVASVRITPSQATVPVLGSTRLLATALDDRGDRLNRQFEWSSDNPVVAKVSSDGTVTVRTQGTARITATIDGRSATAVITAADVRVSTLRVNPGQASLKKDEQMQLYVIARDAQGNPLENPRVSWSSDQESVARVSTSGVLTGVAVGNTTIRAGSDGQTAEVKVTVMEPPPVRSATVTTTPYKFDGRDITVRVDLALQGYNGKLCCAALLFNHSGGGPLAGNTAPYVLQGQVAVMARFTPPDRPSPQFTLPLSALGLNRVGQVRLEAYVAVWEGQCNRLSSPGARSETFRVCVSRIPIGYSPC